MAPVPSFPHECLSCKYGFIWLLLISLSCCGRHEYQNPLHSYKENRPLSPPPTSLLPIEYPDYLPDMACRLTVLFPNALKGKYLLCDQQMMHVPQMVSDGNKGYSFQSPLWVTVMRKSFFAEAIISHQKLLIASNFSASQRDSAICSCMFSSGALGTRVKCHRIKKPLLEQAGKY